MISYKGKEYEYAKPSFTLSRDFAKIKKRYTEHCKTYDGFQEKERKALIVYPKFLELTKMLAGKKIENFDIVELSKHLSEDDYNTLLDFTEYTKEKEEILEEFFFIEENVVDVFKVCLGIDVDLEGDYEEMLRVSIKVFNDFFFEKQKRLNVSMPTTNHFTASKTKKKKR